MVSETSPGLFRLQIPPGEAGTYRLAQLDDYRSKPRRDFPWTRGFVLQLMARSSRRVMPGTWGFGFWNDPFSMAILSGAGMLRLPNLPNSAWFFFSSPPNYLTLRDDLPVCGNLAVSYRSVHIPPGLLLLCAPILTFSLLPPIMRFMRQLASAIIIQDAVDLRLDPTKWHTYLIEVRDNQVKFRVNGSTVLNTVVVPLGPLGLVLWIDNQYAALPPSGKLKFGTLATPENSWIEFKEISYYHSDAS
jgi:hypothetical protein